MPKYYRFRALPPNRKAKRGKEKTLDMLESGKNWLTLACLPAPTWSWYLRRTSWRQVAPAAGVPRQFSAALRNSLSNNNRPVLVLKLPASDFLRL